MSSALDTFKTSLNCTCPACGKGALYEGKYSLNLKEKCKNCGLDYAKGDAADGPAVFFIFILGAALVPLALFVEFTLSPPLWAHALVWGTLALIFTIGLLKPVKAYVIALQYKHRPELFK